MGLLGALLGRLGFFLEASLAVLGPSCEPLGPLWSDIGGLVAILDAAKTKTASVRKYLLSKGIGTRFASWGSLGSPLGGLWGRLGGLLGCLEAILELSGAIFGPRGSRLGPSWSVLGAFRGHRRPSGINAGADDPLGGSGPTPPHLQTDRTGLPGEGFGEGQYLTRRGNPKGSADCAEGAPDSWDEAKKVQCCLMENKAGPFRFCRSDSTSIWPGLIRFDFDFVAIRCGPFFTRRN